MSTDCAVIDGDIHWLHHTLGAPFEGGMFDHWTAPGAHRPELADYLPRCIADLAVCLQRSEK